MEKSQDEAPVLEESVLLRKLGDRNWLLKDKRKESIAINVMKRL